jgi:hypothetical protein
MTSEKNVSVGLELKFVLCGLTLLVGMHVSC